MGEGDSLRRWDNLEEEVREKGERERRREDLDEEGNESGRECDNKT